MMDIGLVGVNHTKMAIQDFEPFFLDRDAKQLFYTKITSFCPISELVILTTCNRIECYFVADSLDVGAQWLMDTLAIQTNSQSNQIQTIFSVFSTEETIDHLFTVVSGLNSMVFGENEILGQVKDAYEVALQKKKTGPYLNKLFQQATAVGKRARSETAISRGAYSVSSIAIDAIRKTYFDYFEKSILILGAGTMGMRCLKKLDALGHPDISIANRNYEKILDAKKYFSVSTYEMDDVFNNLSKFDIIISAVSVKTKLLVLSHFCQIAATQLIIDLGLPRNVDPRIAETFPIDIINVDGLKDIAAKNIRKREDEINNVKTIILEEKTNFDSWVTFRNQHAN